MYELPPAHTGLQLPWNKDTDWAYGSSISLYDATITAGKCTRSGDPIADCFSIVAYKGGALLAVRGLVFEVV